MEIGYFQNNLEITYFHYALDIISTGRCIVLHMTCSVSEFFSGDQMMQSNESEICID